MTKAEKIETALDRISGHVDDLYIEGKKERSHADLLKLKWDLVQNEIAYLRILNDPKQSKLPEPRRGFGWGK